MTWLWPANYTEHYTNVHSQVAKYALRDHLKYVGSLYIINLIELHHYNEAIYLYCPSNYIFICSSNSEILERVIFTNTVQ